MPKQIANITIRAIPASTGIKVNCVDGYSNTWLIVGTKNPNTTNMNAKITIMSYTIIFNEI